MSDRIDTDAMRRSVLGEVGPKSDAIRALCDEVEALRSREAPAPKLTEEERLFLSRFATSPIEDDAEIASGLLRRLVPVEEP